jgi:hypothetical protein
MVMNATLQQQAVIKAKVRPDGTGRLVGVAPITLKNQFGAVGASNVAELKDVNVVELTNGSTLLYNVATQKYDIRHLNDTDISDIDFGTF